MGLEVGCFDIREEGLLDGRLVGLLGRADGFPDGSKLGLEVG